MRKLSVLLTLLLVALCANVSYAYNFWSGEDIPSISVWDEDGQKDLTGGVTTTAEGGKLWYWDFKPTGSTLRWKWYIGSAWFGRGIEYKVDEAWVQMATEDNGVNTINGLDTSKTYRIYIKAKSQSENSTPMGRIVEVTGLDFYNGNGIEYINIYGESGEGTLPMTVSTQEDGSKVWSCEFSPKSTTFQWKWTVKIAGEENARWYGRGVEYFANGQWVQMATVDNGSEKGKNYVNGLDPNKTYRISIKALSAENPGQPIGCIEDTTPQTTWTINVTRPSAYDGFTFGNLQVKVGGEWVNTNDGKYTGGTAPAAFRYETVTLPSPYNDGELYAQNFVWEGQLTANGDALNGAVAELYQANFKFNDNAEGTFGQPKEVTVTANGNTLVAKEVTATRVANAWDYTVMTNRTSLDGAQVTFTSSNDRHEAVSGALSDAAEFTAPVLPSLIPDGLTREDGVFTIFYEGTSAPTIWIWNTTKDELGGEVYTGASNYDNQPKMEAVEGYDNLYRFVYRGDKIDPNTVRFNKVDNDTYTIPFNGAYFREGAFVDEQVPVAVSTPKGWYAMGAFGSEYAEANKMTAYEGAEGIYYIDVTNAQKGAKVWFQSPENASVITPEASGALSLGMKWLAATDENESGYFTFAEDCAEGRLFVNTIANQVILADKTFNPLTGNGTEIVFFMGDKHGRVQNVRFLLGKNGSYETIEGARWTKAPYDGFWFIEIPDVTKYDDLKFSVLVDGEGNGDFYDVTPSLAGDAYDRANWWKFIYGQVEEMKNANGGDMGATSFQTYITPEEYLEEASKTKTTVYIFGQGFTGDGKTPSWLPQNRDDVIEMNLYNGIGVLEMTGIVVATEENPTKLKLSWMPYFKYIDDTDGTVVEKRAWASFNLGIVGGYDAEDGGDVNASSRFYLRKPRYYNNYSESDWVLGDATVPAEKCYLVLDSRERTLTLLTFNPKVGLSENYSIKVEQKAIGNLDESIFADGKMFKGSEAGGNAYPELANDLEVTFTVTPAYMNSEIEGLADKIKELYDVKYQFYNCSHGFKAGESTSDKNSHDGDELIAEFDGPLSGATEFAIKNIVTSNVPQLMIQAVYTLKADVSGNDAKTFHTIPSGLISDTDIKFQTANPILEGDAYKLVFASLYPQEDGNWGVHFQFPFGASTENSEMVYYPDYEVSCGMSSQNAAPTHAGMKHLIENPYAWGMIGYEPYESGDYDHAVHNWSNVALKHSALNLSLDGIASNLDDAAQAVKEGGIDVTLHFVYPYVIYKDQIITQIVKNETPARVARAAVAEPEGEYEIRYAYATTNRLYKEEDLNGVITGVENVAVGAEKPVDVYTVSGALIMRGTTKAEAVKALAPGIYVIGNEKVVVK